MILTELEYIAPSAPEAALDLIPMERSDFGTDLWKVICAAMERLEPEITGGILLCLSLFAVAMMISLLGTFPGKNKSAVELAGVLATAGILLKQTGNMVSVAAETVTELSEYGKLLLPVMTAALASQGGAATSAALYAGTAVFNSLLSSAVAGVLIPVVYIYILASIASAAVGEKFLSGFAELIKWFLNCCLKLIIYLFTGYVSITGVVSGSTDAAALKATRVAMSSVVPVVGGILSEASEAVLVGAGVMKSAAGVYGILALIATVIVPFLRIGILYLMLKVTAGVCDLFDVKAVNSLIRSFSCAMGMLLAMTGTGCILLLISTVCFMKGVTA